MIQINAKFEEKSEYTEESIDRNRKHIQMTLTSILPKLSSQALPIIYSDVRQAT